MPTKPQYDPMENRFLAGLPAAGRARLADDLEMVSLASGQVIYGTGDHFEHVYFPVTCTIALLSITRNGSSAELAMVGNDGLVGITVVLGGDFATHTVVVQSAGAAYRVRAEVMRWELDQCGELQAIALRHANALMVQMAQSVVCNRHHSVEQRMCRWLLHSLDLLSGNEIEMTQEVLASMLGVRREGVTETAGKLQAAGKIKYRRGHISVIDRPGLEMRACECYATVKSEYGRLLFQAEDVRVRTRVRPNPETLRKRAEKRLQQTEAAAPNSTWKRAELLHELQVHQIELEMQLEELGNAYDEVETMRAKYADIYDFAPVAYFTLDSAGIILDLNLAGAILLGIKRSQKNRHRFAAYVAQEDLPVFNRFFADVFRAKDKEVCQVALMATSRRPGLVVRIEAVTDEDRHECRMVVMDTAL